MAVTPDVYLFDISVLLSTEGNMHDDFTLGRLMFLDERCEF